MWKETKKFAINLWVKDKKSQEIIELKRTVDLEVLWERKYGWVKKQVDFRKDGKVYWILVEIELVKYLFGTRDTIARSKFTVPPIADYETYKGYMGEPNNSPEKDKERQDDIILIEEWKIVRITIFSLTIIGVIVLLGFLFFKSKRSSGRS